MNAILKGQFTQNCHFTRFLLATTSTIGLWWWQTELGFSFFWANSAFKPPFDFGIYARGGRKVVWVTALWLNSTGSGGKRWLEDRGREMVWWFWPHFFFFFAVCCLFNSQPDDPTDRSPQCWREPSMFTVFPLTPPPAYTYTLLHLCIGSKRSPVMFPFSFLFHILYNSVILFVW